jgi:hypothetical protein
MESLNKTWQEVSTQMYQAASQQQPGAGPQGGADFTGQEQQAGSGKKDEKKVEDADFEVMDDNNK